MAGIKVNRKFKGSTLLESLIAMTLITIVFLLSSQLFVNVIGSGFSLAKFNAELVLDDIAIESRQSKSHFDEAFERSDLKILKRVLKYKDSERLLYINLQAFDQENTKLAERRELILNQ
jgi:hypothetical protein